MLEINDVITILFLVLIMFVILILLNGYLIVLRKRTEKTELELIEVTKESTKQTIKVKNSLEILHRRMGEKDERSAV